MDALPGLCRKPEETCEHRDDPETEQGQANTVFTRLS
jgi:hypothetical protein